MRRILTNTTALVACLSLSLPAPLLGQDAETEEPEICEDGTEPPCEPAEDAAAGEAGENAEAESATEGAAGDAGEDEADVSPAPEETIVTEEPLENEADIEVEPEAVEDGDAAAEGTAEAAAEAGAAAEPETADTLAEPEAAEAETEAEEGAEEAVGGASEADDAEADDTAPEAGAAAEPEAADTLAGPEAAEAEGAETGVEEEAEEAVGGASEAEDAEAEDAAPEAEAVAGDEAEAEAEDAEEQVTATEQIEQAETVAGEPATEAEREAAEAEAAAAEEAAATARSAAAATAEADAEAEVTEETVTEATSRSSDENFTSRIREVFDGSGGDNRDLLVGTVLGALGGFAASQLLGDRQVVASSEDRVVVQRADGEYQILKDDNALLRQPGSQVRTQTFDDGSTRTVVTRPDGSQVITIRDAELRVLRRTRITPDGHEIVLIDDTRGAQAIDVSTLRFAAETETGDLADEEALRRALAAAQRPDRAYSLAQVREVQAVRALAPAIQLDNITFETGSAAIRPDQAEQLNELGQLIADMIADDPREIFLVEGHTDAVGGAAMNLALSDRRAESVALALTEYFDVPPENLVVQGYGERYLKIDTQEAERLNRRASVRRITELLQVASAQ